MVRSIFLLGGVALLGSVSTLVFSVPISSAQVRQSTSYRIQSDSINFAGGLSTSTNYALEATAGEVGTGAGVSSNYSLKAGYQQMQEVYIAISNVADLVLTPNISGVSGGVSNGSTTVTVTTDSTSGYALTIAASTNPAMKKGADVINDYVPLGAPPDLIFTTGVTNAHFGFSPQGNNIVQRFKDNGSACNVGLLDTALSCWQGLSTTASTIASASTGNHPLGATTTINFRVGIGSSVVQPEGVYTATTTITALPL